MTTTKCTSAYSFYVLIVSINVPELRPVRFTRGRHSSPICHAGHVGRMCVGPEPRVVVLGLHWIAWLRGVEGWFLNEEMCIPCGDQLHSVGMKSKLANAYEALSKVSGLINTEQVEASISIINNLTIFVYIIPQFVVTNICILVFLVVRCLLK